MIQKVCCSFSSALCILGSAVLTFINEAEVRTHQFTQAKCYGLIAAISQSKIPRDSAPRHQEQSLGPYSFSITPASVMLQLPQHWTLVSTETSLPNLMLQEADSKTHLFLLIKRTENSLPRLVSSARQY